MDIELQKYYMIIDTLQRYINFFKFEKPTLLIQIMLTLIHLKLYIHIKKETKDINSKEAQTKTFLNNNVIGFGYRYENFYNSDTFHIMLFTNYIEYDYGVNFRDDYRVINIYYIKKHPYFDYNLIHANHNIYIHLNIYYNLIQANHNIYLGESTFVFHGKSVNIGTYKIILPDIPRYNLKSNVSEKLYNRRR